MSIVPHSTSTDRVFQGRTFHAVSKGSVGYGFSPQPRAEKRAARQLNHAFRSGLCAQAWVMRAARRFCRRPRRIPSCPRSPRPSGAHAGVRAARDPQTRSARIARHQRPAIATADVGAGPARAEELLDSCALRADGVGAHARGAQRLRAIALAARGAFRVVRSVPSAEFTLGGQPERFLAGNPDGPRRAPAAVNPVHACTYGDRRRARRVLGNAIFFRVLAGNRHPPR